MNRRPHTQSYGRDRWMVSYLDVLTILLIFFLTAAAMARKGSAPLSRPPLFQPSLARTSLAQDRAQTQPLTAGARPHESARERKGIESNGTQPIEAKDSDRKSAGSVSDPELARVARQLQREGLNVRDVADTQDGHTGERGLAILLPQAALFSPGDDRIRSQAFAPLRKIAAVLRGVPYRVNLAGYADATPIHNHRFRNNWELAAARSLRLMEALTERYGIDERRVSISSYGSLEPKGPNDTVGGRASNRRVEILILSDRPAGKRLMAAPEPLAD